MPINLTRDLAIQILQTDRKSINLRYEEMAVINKRTELLNKVAWDYDTSRHCTDWETIVVRAQGFIDCALQSTTDEQALQILREIQN